MKYHSRKAWAVKPNGKHYTIVGAKRLPRKLKKFCTTILDLTEGQCVMTSLHYYDLLTEQGNQLTHLKELL